MKTLVYIIGSGHCGSTLLDIILGNHSDVFSSGELDKLNFDSLCSCSKKVGECEYWRDLKKYKDITRIKVYRGKYDFLLN